jgi:glycosyltransferase involved in cell wall biosynthesis
MGEQPLVSVVIPSYNRAHSIGQTLDSLVAQTHRNWEAIVVDDGSRDQTRQVVEPYLRYHPVRYVYQTNHGVSWARNRGMALATGDYIALLDSDDIWHPWKLELQVRVFDAFPDSVMNCTDMSAIGPDRRLVNERHLRSMYSAYRWFTNETLYETAVDLALIAPPEVARLYPGTRVWKGSLFSPMLMGNLIHTSTVVMKRSVVEKVGEFRTDWRFCEDYHYFTRISKEGPIAYIDVPSMLYQTGMPDQLTGLHHFEGAINYLTCLREFIDKNRRRITLPRSMMRRTVADAHLWIAELMMMANDYPGAREHLINALRYRASGRALAQFSIACLPSAVRSALRATYRNLKAAAA